jgi:trimeric autotransporter adhesin
MATQALRVRRGFSIMLIHKPKSHFILSFVTLSILAVTVACTGFFVDPTLTSLAVGPSTPSVQEGDTLQMASTGTYDDGSTKNLTSSSTWSSSDETIATVNSTGKVTGVSAGTTTIKASSGTVEGSTSLTVTVANLSSITVGPSNVSLTSGGTQDYTATGHFSSGSDRDITEAVTWSVNPSTAADISNAAGTKGNLTAQSVTQTTTVTVTATSGSVTGTATLTINPNP